VYLHQHLADRLPDALRSRLAAALKPALGAVGRFDPQPADTEAYLGKVAASCVLASALGDSGAATRAAGDFAAWLKSVSAAGFPILQQPTPVVEAVAALHWIWLAAPNDAVKRGAAGALEYLYRDLALRYQPAAGVVGGAVARGHYGDYAGGTSATRYLLYAQAGCPPLAVAEPFAMFLVVPGFAPSEGTVALARALDAPRLVRAASGERRLTTYLHPRFALGTLSGPVDTRTTPVAITYGTPGEPGAFCRARPVPCRVAVLQDDACALVSFDFDQVGYDDDRRQVDLRFYLGPRSALDSVRVNEDLYTTDYAVAVETRSAVITERNGVYTAVTPIAMGPIDEKSWDATPQPAELKWDTAESPDDPWLVLTLPSRWLEARETARDNFRVALAVEVASQDDYVDAATFAKAVYEERRVKQDASLKRVKVGERNERMNQQLGLRRPVERADWIIETQVLQDLTFTAGTDVLQLSEDLQQNRVVTETVNSVPLPWDFLYRSPSLNHSRGDALDACLRPPPAPPEPPPAPAP
jgi:hypothetical protein